MIKLSIRGGALPAAVAAASLAVGLGACGSSSNSGGSTSSGAGSTGASTGASGKQYVVATSADFPPMSSRSPDNPDQVVGFEPDMIKAVMDHLGWSYKVVTSDFNGLIPSVQSGRADLVVSDIYDTPERRRVVDFVDYLSNNFAVMVTSGNAGKTKSFADVCGKAIGVLTGSAPELEAAKAGSKQCTDAGKPALQVRSYPAVAQELPALANGTLYAILETNVSLSYIEKQQRGKYQVVFDVPGDKTQVGIVVKKGSATESKLAAAIAWYLGTPDYKANAQKWGLPTSALMSPAS
jgi:polar amino acid transport system substrate-binding protein